MWPPNTVFTRNPKRQWLQLLRKIVLATPPLSLWNSDTDVEFPLFFCCHWVEARTPILLSPSYLPVCISNLTSAFRGLIAILKLNLSHSKINAQLSLPSPNQAQVGLRVDHRYGEDEETTTLSGRSIKLQIFWTRGSMGALEECLYGSE